LFALQTSLTKHPGPGLGGTQVRIASGIQAPHVLENILKEPHAGEVLLISGP
jgi:hypothetical protein